MCLYVSALQTKQTNKQKNTSMSLFVAKDALSFPEVE